MWIALCVALLGLLVACGGEERSKTQGPVRPWIPSLPVPHTKLEREEHDVIVAGAAARGVVVTPGEVRQRWLQTDAETWPQATLQDYLTEYGVDEETANYRFWRALVLDKLREARGMTAPRASERALAERCEILCELLMRDRAKHGRAGASE
jgi:hypothetical protein